MRMLGHHQNVHMLALLQLASVRSWWPSDYCRNNEFSHCRMDHWTGCSMVRWWQEGVLYQLKELSRSPP